MLYQGLPVLSAENEHLLLLVRKCLERSLVIKGQAGSWQMCCQIMAVVGRFAMWRHVMWLLIAPKRPGNARNQKVWNQLFVCSTVAAGLIVDCGLSIVWRWQPGRLHEL
jgi:hypothetical protein